MHKPYTTRLEDSRKTIFPDFINLSEFKFQMIKHWKESIINQDIVNNHQENKELPTMPISLVMKAGNILADKLLSLEKDKIKVLEIMAGNCAGSRILLNTIKKKLEVKKWISTDIIDFTKNIKEKEIEFEKLNGLESVKKFSQEIDIFLMMCPPPNKFISGNCVNPMSLCDYYSIVDFIDFSYNKGKMIVFIGELGSSDGTEGMYNFMLSNTKIKLLHREMLFTGYNKFGLIEKEIFIFLVI